MHEGSITIHLPVDLREIERLNRVVRQFGELHEVPSRELYAINLALDEVLTNVVRHGFDDPGGQEIVAQVTVGGNELASVVADPGRAFNPLEASPPDLSAPLAERALGGLGIHLVRSLMDAVEYHRENGKNVLTLRKRVR